MSFWASKPKDAKVDLSGSLFHYSRNDVGRLDVKSCRIVTMIHMAQTVPTAGAWMQRYTLYGPEHAEARAQVQDLIRKSRLSTDLLDPMELRALGSMLGMAVGDALGAPVEFLPVQYDRLDIVTDMGEVMGLGGRRLGNFQLLAGQWTDDTSMGLCLADSLLWAPVQQHHAHDGDHDGFNPTDCMLRFLAWWHFGYNNAFADDDLHTHSVGLGGNINQSFKSFLVDGSEYTTAGDRNVSGNGSIMRCAAVPVRFHLDIDLAMRVAERQSRTTHGGDEAAECCRLLTFIIVTAMHKGSKAFLDTLGQSFTTPVESVRCLANSVAEGDSPDRNWNWKAQQFRYSPRRVAENPGYMGSYAMDGMAMALHCVYTTSDFRSALLKVANVCGDADSVASVCGQIAGAIYGIQAVPEAWIHAVQRWDHGGDIALRASYLYHQRRFASL